MKKTMLLALILSILFPSEVLAAESDTYLSEDIQYYCSEIGEWYGLSPELLMAIVERESSGDSDAENGSCKGLMQVSTRWHYDRMERLGVEDIFDAYGNIMVGTDYLVELIEKHGDIGVALMVYNGDSSAMNYANGNCEISNYAKGIIERSYQLERLHGKR